jgi:hypothetical protein
MVVFSLSGGVFAGVNSQFSLELKVEASLESKVHQLVSERLAPNHGFSKDEIEALVHDLAVLASINGGKPSALYKTIFSQNTFSGSGFFQWLITGIKQLKASHGEPCTPLSKVDYFGCSNISARSITLPPEYFQNNRIRRILTLIHERRHLDGYDHIPNTPSYDKEVKGTRGAQLAFIVSLVNSCTNCTIMAKQEALSNKEEIVGAMKNLSEDDSQLLQIELASLQNIIPVEVSTFLGELKRQQSFLSVSHMECKNKVPLYEYEQHRTVPNVDAQDCFIIYYKKGKSPHLGEQFPEPITRFGVLFLFVPTAK